MANRKNEDYPLSRPFMIIKASLSSTSAHKLYAQNFKAVSNHLYNITKMTRIVGNDEVADVAEAEIQKIFSSCQQDLEDEIARLKKLLSDNVVTGNTGYEVTEEYDVKITTSYGNQFLELIKLNDKVSYYIDQAQFIGLLNVKQQMAGVYRYEKRVRKAANKIREMGNILKAYAKAQSSGQDLKAVETKMRKQLSGDSASQAAA